MAAARDETPSEAGDYAFDTLQEDPFEFRLLQIVSIEPDADGLLPLHCILRKFRFEEAPPYRCLSYVWGHGGTKSIFVDEEMPCGHQSSAVATSTVSLKLQVTKNLLGFLQVMRVKSGDPEGWLWIDAVCINQAGKRERSHHVAQMGRIYSRAIQVICWLGWEWDRLGDGSDDGKNEFAECRQVPRCEEPCTHNLEDGAEHAIEYIRDIAKGYRAWMARQHGDEHASLPRFGFDHPSMYELLDIQPATMKLWAAVAVFLHRAWFKRAWVVQEAVLAEKLVLVCGTRVIPWDDLLQASIFLHTSGWVQRLLSFVSPRNEAVIPPGWHVPFFAAMKLTVKNRGIPQALRAVTGRMKLSHGRIDSMQETIVKTLPFDATDPRDKIYAPVALWKVADPNQLDELPAISYETDVADVYKAWTTLMLEKSSDLSLLSYAGIRAQEVSTQASTWSLPSWVPDYSITTLNVFQDIPGTNYDAFPNRKKFCRRHGVDDTLEVNGILIDTIVELDVLLREHYMKRDFRPLMEFCLKLIRGGYRKAADALWRTTIGNRGESPNSIPRDRTLSSSDASDAAGFKLYLKLCTAIYLYGDHSKSEKLECTPDWSEWKVFDEVCSSSATSAESIPSVNELRAYAENWRDIMKSGVTKLAEAKEVGPADAYALAAARMFPGRCLVVTQKGNLGLAPIASQKGDEIWLLAGARVPFVLRPQGMKGYMLLGEVYLHGGMHGEADCDGLDLTPVLLH